jgi:hypothetical protein
MSFKRFDQEDITISAESIAAPAWTGQQSILPAFFTSSLQAGGSSGNYYFNVYQADPSTTGAEVQFAVAFGNRNGSGSVLFNSTIEEKSPSSVIYGQYRTLVNGDEDTDFTFNASQATPNSVYIISVNRSRYKEKLLPGSLNLTLTEGNKTIKLTDNSRDVNTISYVDSGRVYDLVSGSNGAVNTTLGAGYNTFIANSGSYGKFLPDVGLIVLNSNALKDATYGIGITVDETKNTNGLNNQKIYNAIRTGGSFELRSEETITSNYVFVRVRNSEYNYSTNPSNITGSGELRHTIMVNTPQAYITTVGLYNDNNDLLGVAKLSRPLLKDFTKEALVRIKLDY